MVNAVFACGAYVEVAWVTFATVKLTEGCFLVSCGLLTVQVPVVSVVQDMLPVTPPLHVPVTVALDTGPITVCTVTATVACHPFVAPLAVPSSPPMCILSARYQNKAISIAVTAIQARVKSLTAGFSV
jgi:hypothetical protein